MLKKYLSILSAASIFLLSGCTLPINKLYNNATYERSYIQEGHIFKNNKKERELLIDYKQFSKNVVNTIFTNKSPQAVIVTDFVNLTSLNNNTKLGFVLSNSLKDTIVNTKHIPVIEAEVSKYFKLSGNGLKILSRDINKVKSTDFQVEEAVVGTYTYTDRELIVFTKLINLKTGVIEGSYAQAFPMTQSTKMLLAKH